MILIHSFIFQWSSLKCPIHLTTCILHFSYNEGLKYRPFIANILRNAYIFFFAVMTSVNHQQSGDPWAMTIAPSCDKIFLEKRRAKPTYLYNNTMLRFIKKKNIFLPCFWEHHPWHNSVNSPLLCINDPSFLKMSWPFLGSTPPCRSKRTMAIRIRDCLEFHKHSFYWGYSLLACIFHSITLDNFTTFVISNSCNKIH